MANYWTEQSGKILITLVEKVTTTFALPIKSEYLPLASSNMNITVSSGSIPKGMKLNGHVLEGTPFEVNKDNIEPVNRANPAYQSIYDLMIEARDPTTIWKTEFYDNLHDQICFSLASFRIFNKSFYNMLFH